MTRFLALFILALPTVLFAHGGGLNASGCHNDRKRGGYHCHRNATRPRKTRKSPSRQPKATREAKSPPKQQAGFSGTITRVVDGDDLEIARGKGSVRIRLYGVDCPEKGQPFWKDARKFTSGVALKKDVSVRVLGEDRHGRTIADVILPDGISLAHELIKAGLAWWYQEHAGEDKLLGTLEAKARKEKRGLWAGKNPVEPRLWRRGERGPSTRPRPPPQASPTENNETTVYVTRTGKKYHRGNCRHLRRSKIPMKLTRARTRYGPCKVCGPPR
ncbi:thermonuclease family protein [Elusimicrobiota bacterium]